MLILCVADSADSTVAPVAEEEEEEGGYNGRPPPVAPKQPRSKGKSIENITGEFTVLLLATSVVRILTSYHYVWSFGDDQKPCLGLFMTHTEKCSHTCTRYDFVIIVQNTIEHHIHTSPARNHNVPRMLCSVTMLGRAVNVNDRTSQMVWNL